MSKSEVVAGVMLSYVQTGAYFLLGLVWTPFLLKYLGKPEYGLFQLMGAFAGYIAILDFGFGTAVTRYVSGYTLENKLRERENFLAMCVVIYACIAVFILLAGTIVYTKIDIIFGKSLNNVEMVKAKTMYAILLFNVAAVLFGQVFTGLLTGCEKYVFQRVVSIFRILLNIFLGIVLVVMGVKSVGLTVFITLLNYAMLILNAFYAIFVLKIKIKYYYFDVQLFKEVFKFSFYIFLYSLVGVLYWKLGEFLLGVMKDTSYVAEYSVAMQIVILFNCMVNPIGVVLLPKAAKLEKQNADGKTLTDFMVYTGRYILIVYSYFTLGFLFFGKNFLEIWAGKDFHTAYLVVAMIISATLIWRIQTAGFEIAKAYNKHGFLTVFNVFAALLNIGTSILCISRWGTVGAAVGTTVSIILCNIIVANIYYRKALNIDIAGFFRGCFSGIGAVLLLLVPVGVLLNYFIPNPGLVAFLVKGGIFTGFFLIVLYLIGLNSEEKKLVSTIFFRRFENA